MVDMALSIGNTQNTHSLITILIGKMMIIHSYHGGSLTWHTDHFDGFPCVALCEINVFCRFLLIDFERSFWELERLVKSSYHIISYRIISYHINFISYHIISYPYYSIDIFPLCTNFIVIIVSYSRTCFIPIFHLTAVYIECISCSLIKHTLP